MVEAQLSIRPEVNGHMREADNPQSPVVRFGSDKPLKLDAGVELSPFQIAYQTYGTLNADRSNAVLVCHALTGDQYVASEHPITGKPGWWEVMIGPGRPIDTDRFFVICPNILGGCMGSTGPASINPRTGKVSGLDFNGRDRAIGRADMKEPTALQDEADFVFVMPVFAIELCEHSVESGCLRCDVDDVCRDISASPLEFFDLLRVGL